MKFVLVTEKLNFKQSLLQSSTQITFFFFFLLSMFETGYWLLECKMLER